MARMSVPVASGACTSRTTRTTWTCTLWPHSPLALLPHFASAGLKLNANTAPTTNATNTPRMIPSTPGASSSRGLPSSRAHPSEKMTVFAARKIGKILSLIHI